MASSSFASTFDDPRVTTQFCRRLSRPDGDLVFVGVVHDHPASVGRVRAVLESVEPDTLALELPAAAVPLYRAYARDEQSPPRFGGEMSAAIDAAPDASVVGIDAPNWPFLRRLFARLVADRVSPSTARRLVSSLGGATRDAVTCRVAATLMDVTSVTIAHDEPIEYSCDHADDSRRQADHERTHVSTVQTLLASTETDDNPRTYRDETRERCMIEQLRNETGTVVAVVGIDHLESIVTGVADTPQ